MKLKNLSLILLMHVAVSGNTAATSDDEAQHYFRRAEEYRAEAQQFEGQTDSDSQQKLHQNLVDAIEFYLKAHNHGHPKGLSAAMAIKPHVVKQMANRDQKKLTDAVHVSQDDADSDYGTLIKAPTEVKMKRVALSREVTAFDEGILLFQQANKVTDKFVSPFGSAFDEKPVQQKNYDKKDARAKIEAAESLIINSIDRFIEAYDAGNKKALIEATRAHNFLKGTVQQIKQKFLGHEFWVCGAISTRKKDIEERQKRSMAIADASQSTREKLRLIEELEE